MSSASWYSTVPGFVRADPKIDTAMPSSASRPNPSTNSAWMRMTRHGSVCTQSDGPRRSSSRWSVVVAGTCLSRSVTGPWRRTLRALLPPIVLSKVATRDVCSSENTDPATEQHPNNRGNASRNLLAGGNPRFPRGRCVMLLPVVGDDGDRQGSQRDQARDLVPGDQVGAAGGDGNGRRLHGRVIEQEQVLGAAGRPAGRLHELGRAGDHRGDRRLGRRAEQQAGQLG